MSSSGASYKLTYLLVILAIGMLMINNIKFNNDIWINVVASVGAFEAFFYVFTNFQKEVFGYQKTLAFFCSLSTHIVIGGVATTAWFYTWKHLARTSDGWLFAIVILLWCYAGVFLLTITLGAVGKIVKKQKTMSNNDDNIIDVIAV